MNHQVKSRSEIRLASALFDCVAAMNGVQGKPSLKQDWDMALRKGLSTLDQYKRGDHPSKGSYLKVVEG